MVYCQWEKNNRSYILFEQSVEKDALNKFSQPFLKTVDDENDCATSRKVSGSIPDAVTEIFHLHNPSGRTMALGLTQSLTDMSTRKISWE